MLLLWLYVYLPAGLACLAYTAYLAVKGRWRHRLLGVAWLLLALAAEWAHLRS